MTTPEEAVKTLLRHIGEDPTRDGLQNTPKRVVKALTEMTQGYNTDIEALLNVKFEVDFDEMVVLTGIAFTSLCEHHMLPFVGTATVGYIPNQGVVGISKLARLVEAHAQRLQVQERMTQDIAQDLQKHLDPVGVGVIIKAHHQCMSCRGIRKSNTEMITSAVYGDIKHVTAARAEFLAFTK
jgi:GTP cyclohydrolase I